MIQQVELEQADVGLDPAGSGPVWCDPKWKRWGDPPTVPLHVLSAGPGATSSEICHQQCVHWRTSCTLWVRKWFMRRWNDAQQRKRVIWTADWQSLHLRALLVLARPAMPQEAQRSLAPSGAIMWCVVLPGLLELSCEHVLELIAVHLMMSVAQQSYISLWCWKYICLSWQTPYPLPVKFHVLLSKSRIFIDQISHINPTIPPFFTTISRCTTIFSQIHTLVINDGWTLYG